MQELYNGIPQFCNVGDSTRSEESGMLYNTLKIPVDDDGLITCVRNDTERKIWFRYL